MTSRAIVRHYGSRHHVLILTVVKSGRVYETANRLFDRLADVKAAIKHTDKITWHDYSEVKS